MAMGRKIVVIMVARGDLGVEIGFERMAKIQEEILWICEAGHVRDYLRNVMISLLLHKPSPSIRKAKLDKRGLLYVAFDGRYKIGRYYAPTAVNTPKTLDEVLKNNDIQVFDLQCDPDEMHNLAVEPEKNRETILRMNQLLNDLIAKEVGVNDGKFLTPIIGPK
jgi:arylsulfatase